MRRFRDATIPATDDDAIQAFSRNFLARHDALFRARQTQQRIRDCHGDLHSEHICDTASGLVIFDCIEFNERFRYCDVASEIAFLAMDLDYHGEPGLSQRLIAHYAACTDDPDLARLVPFYQCYRAYVRGKVDSLTSAEEEVSADERATARAGAYRHFALAYRYTWAYSPCLVVITGLSGTGKSALAAALHARTAFTHLNSDVVRKQLARVPLDAPRTTAYDTGLYAPEMSARTYDAMYRRTAEQLAAGRGVILDGTFQRRVDRDAARAIAARHGVPVLFVECHCDEDEVRRRLERRMRLHESPSDADWTIYLQQRQRFEPFGPDEHADHYLVDTAHPLTDAVASIERELRTRVS